MFQVEIQQGSKKVDEFLPQESKIDFPGISVLSAVSAIKIMNGVIAIQTKFHDGFLFCKVTDT
jgi:hypothetical protein